MAATLALASGGALIGLAATPASAAPFGNGSFEDPAIDASHLHVPGEVPSIPSWTLASGDVDIVNSLWQAQHGSQSIDLNGFEQGSLCQAFDTLPDRPYLLEFYMSRNGMLGMDSATMDVSVDGADPEEFIHDTESWSQFEDAESPGPQWEYHSVSFTSDGTGTSTVCFTSTTAGTDTGEGIVAATGPALDNVSVTLQNSPPTATIVTPPNGAVYTVGQDVDADYSCDDVDDNLLSCVGDVPDGDPIDTDTPGFYEFNVTATDTNEAQGFDSSGYEVRAVGGLCEGTALQLLNGKLANANPKGAPCKSRNASLVRVNQVIGPPMPPYLSALNSTIQVRALGSSTTNGDGFTSAEASVASAVINLTGLGLKIELGAIHSISGATLNTCTPGEGEDGVTTSGLSRVATLRINNGNALRIQGYSAIPLLGLGTLHINQKVASPNGIIHRGVFLDLAGTSLDVVIAESIAGIGCVPNPLPG